MTRAPTVDADAECRQRAGTASGRWRQCLRLPPALICALALLLFSGSGAAQPQTWKINLKNADIREFISQVASITGRTFVVDPRVKGNVTVISTTSLDEDGVYELFLSVLRVHGFGASLSGDVIRIEQNTIVKQSGGVPAALSELPPEQIVTRVIAAQNVDAAELVKTLRPMIPQYGHIAAVAHPNVVIISDHADNIERLMRIIAQIDVADVDEFVVIPMKHAWVGNIVSLLEKLAPEQLGRNAKGPQSVQVIANERNNTMVLRGRTRAIGEVMALIERLDQPATTTGATRVIYLSHGDAVNVAEILNGMISDTRSTGGGEGGAPPDVTQIQPDESLNAIVVRADPATMSEIMEIVAQLDVRRAQVLIESAIVEIGIDDRFDIGVEAAAVDTGGDSVPLVTTTLNGLVSNLFNNLTDEAGNPVPPISAVAAAGSPTLAVARLNQAGVSFGVIVNALASDTNANLLSTPSVLTLDNQEAKILVGQQVPFRTGSFTTTSDGASNPFTTIQREDVGIELTVTPHVHEGNSVRLEVMQVVENVIDTGLAIGEAGVSDLVTNKRSIETMILADDGETIVLGGLIQDDIRETIKKVPFFGDIPVLGHLFRNTSQTTQKRNLLVFLRPTILRDEEDVKVTTERKYRDVYEVLIQSRPNTPEPKDIDELYRGRPDSSGIVPN